MEIQTKGSIETIIVAFDSYLRRCCGACEKTCSEYGRYVRYFLETKSRGSIVDVTSLDASDLIRFITEQASRYKPKTAKLIATALRSFLRCVFR